MFGGTRMVAFSGNIAKSIGVKNVIKSSAADSFLKLRFQQAIKDKSLSPKDIADLQTWLKNEESPGTRKEIVELLGKVLSTTTDKSVKTDILKTLNETKGKKGCEGAAKLIADYSKPKKDINSADSSGKNKGVDTANVIEKKDHRAGRTTITTTSFNDKVKALRNSNKGSASL